jgi:hypothetical protein
MVVVIVTSKTTLGLVSTIISVFFDGLASQIASSSASSAGDRFACTPEFGCEHLCGERNNDIM